MLLFESGHNVNNNCASGLEFQIGNSADEQDNGNEYELGGYQFPIDTGIKRRFHNSVYLYTKGNKNNSK